jgi:uncharacterized protein YndB with AHSA1/START domain
MRRQLSIWQSKQCASVASRPPCAAIDEEDFREGGQDRFHCGSKSEPNIHGATRYLDITLNRRIVSSETITMDGQRLCVSLSTLELAPDGRK